MEIIEIKDINNNKIALIFKKSIKAKGGVRFLTPVDYPLQIGLIERPAGDEVKPHIHKNLKYNVSITQEFIYIERGRMIARFYDNDFNLLNKYEIEAGDFVLSISGGHSFEFLDDVRLIEVKQGPYPGDEYAKIFRD